MATYIVRRLIGLVPIALLVSVIAFVLINLSPGDPTYFYVSADAPPEEFEQMREQLGIDQPLAVQFTRWFGEVLRGDLGISFDQRRPVVEVYLSALPITLLLAVMALIIALVIAIPIGVYSAVKSGSVGDKISTLFIFIGVSMPNFWLGMLLVLFFSISLGVMPAQGFNTATVWTRIHSLMLPAFALGFAQAALIARMTRSSMLEVMRQDYVQTARAKGLRAPTVLLKHTFVNALNPIVTVIGLAIASLVAGSAIIEVVFNLPGIGRLMVNSVIRRDYPMVQGTLLLTASMIILVNLLIDIVYAFLDPRIRYD